MKGLLLLLASLALEAAFLFHAALPAGVPAASPPPSTRMREEVRPGPNPSFLRERARASRATKSAELAQPAGTERVA